MVRIEGLTLKAALFFFFFFLFFFLFLWDSSVLWRL